MSDPFEHSFGSAQMDPVEFGARKREGTIDEIAVRASNAFLTALARHRQRAGDVFDLSDEQVSPTQILVLPAVPLPGGYGDRGRPGLHD